jgi:hypothetical protein
MAPLAQPGSGLGPTHAPTTGPTHAQPTGPIVAPRPPVAIFENHGTLTTPNGPINWTMSSNGTLEAEGGGQKVTATGNNASDGSFQKHADYARTGQPPYLTMDLDCEAAERKAQFRLIAGSSQLTLAVSNIDARVTSGTATLSGTWHGAPVHWTGPADLTSNPLVSRPTVGWPKGAFTTELSATRFFAPLGKALAQMVTAPPTATTGNEGVHMESASGVVGRAAAWCIGGAIAGASGDAVTFGGASVLGCAGGVAASLLNDLVTWADSNDDGPIIEPPVIDPPPPDPEPTGPDTQTQPDDPPPPPPSGDGGGGDYGGGEASGGAGGGKPDDKRPPSEEN